jgi:Mrp family chromosome partitioning ATPase
LLLALVGGFVLGSVLAIGLEAFTRPVRDRAELTALFPVPVLATIPRIAGRRGSVPPWDFSPVAFEQVRLLRVQLSLSAITPVIMVTSAGAGDGKTTIAAALAAAFAEADEDVILMDLDLRKPDLSALLEVDIPRQEIDFTDSFPEGVPIPVPQLPRVKVVPAPRGDFAKFESVVRQLPEMLAKARRMASCVIIDTAPVGEVSETLRIAPICDQVVFVTRPRHTDRRRLILARDLLERADAPLGGLVVVGEDGGIRSGKYAYGYGHAPNGLFGEGNEPPFSARRDRAAARTREEEEERVSAARTELGRESQSRD